MADNNLTPDDLKFSIEDSGPIVPDVNTSGVPTNLDYDIMFTEFADKLDNIVYPTYFDESNKPGIVGKEYNPFESTMTQDDTLKGIDKEIFNVLHSTPKNPLPLMPVYSNKRVTNFDWYYNHPKFNSLGWNPYRDNETYYNENSTIWDDFSRMGSQYGKLLTTGFVSAYRSLGDIFDDDDYFTGKDLDSAREFADAMRIGNSTRGGVGGFLNNLGLQSAYTMGIVLNIAAEEALLATITGGGSIFTSPLRTGAKVKEVVKTMARATPLRNAEVTRDVANSLNNIDNAKGFWQGISEGDNLLFKIIAPETMQTRRTLATAQKAGKNIGDLAKTTKTFGGFYRDFRAMNFALSEGKMESGMVYDQVIANGLAIKQQQSDTNLLSQEDIDDVKEKANKASFATTLLNAPAIYLTNQLVLGNAFGAYNRSLAKFFSDNSNNIMKKFIRIKPKVDDAGKVIAGGIKRISPGIKGAIEKIKNVGVAGGFIGTGAAALRYFSANFAEGVQEVYQEAVAHGTEHYYQALIKDPSFANTNLFANSLDAAIDSQMSAQGFEVFLSGFLMGGLIQGPQRLLFQGLPNFGQKVFNNKEYTKYIKEKEASLDRIEKLYNESFKEYANDPKAFFDLTAQNLSTQKQASESMLEFALLADTYAFIDAKDHSKFHNIFTLANTGGLDLFRAQIKDYLKLSDEDLKTAFPSLRDDIKNGKIRERLTSSLNEIDKIEDSYYKHKDKFINPFDPSTFKPGSIEYQEEALKHLAYNHVRYLAMFTSNEVRRAAERMLSIYGELEGSALYDKMAANDLTVLLSKDSLANEVKLLTDEIALLEDKQEIKKKEKKLNNLKNILTLVSEKQKVDGSFDFRSKGKLKTLFTKYVSDLAEMSNSTVELDNLDRAIKKIFDYSKLQRKKERYTQTIQYLSDPQKFDDVFQGAYKARKKIFENGAKIFKESIEKAIQNTEIQNLLNTFAKAGLYIDPEETERFIKTGDISELQTFYDRNGEVVPGGASDMKILLIKSNYLKVQLDKNKDKDKDDEDKLSVLNDIISKKIQAFYKENDISMPESIDEASVEAITIWAKQIFDKINTRYELTDNAKDQLEKNIDEYIYSLIPLYFKYLNDNNFSTDKGLVRFKAFYKEYSNLDNPNALLTFIYGEIIGEENLDYEEQFIKVLAEEEEDLDYLTRVQNAKTESDLDIILDEATKELDQVSPELLLAINKKREQFKKRPSIEYDRELASLVILVQKQNDVISIVMQDGNQTRSLTKNAKEYLGLKKDTFDTVDEAKQAVDNIEVNEDGIFEINGVEYRKGLTLYDNENKKWIIQTSLADYLKNDGVISISDEKGNDIKKISSTFLQKNYSKDKIKVDDDAAKLTSLTNEIELIFNKEGEDAISDEVKVAILSLLSEDDYKNFNVTISVSKDFKPRVFSFGDKTNEKMRRVTQPYFVTLTPNKELLIKINNHLKARKLKVIKEDAWIAYMQTGLIEFLDAKNDPINPLKINFEQAKVYWEVKNPQTKKSGLTEDQFKDIRRNFAKVQLLKQRIQEQNLLNQRIPYDEFVEKTGIALDKSINYEYAKDNLVKLTELPYHTYANGQILIVRNTEKDGKITSTIVVNDKLNLSDQNKEDIINSYKLIEQVKGFQGYVAIIKLPNGGLVAAPLKAKQISDESIVEFFKSIYDISTQELDKDQYKEEIEKIKYFITFKPGEFLNFNVFEKGKIKVTFNVGKSEETIELNANDFNTQDIPELLDLINEKFKAKNIDLALTKEAFKKYFPTDATVDELVESTVTTLSQNMFASGYKYIIKAVKSEDVNDILNAPVDNTKDDDSDNTDPEIKGKEALQKKLDDLKNQRDLFQTSKMLLTPPVKKDPLTKEEEERLEDLNNELDKIDGLIVAYQEKLTKLNTANKIVSKEHNAQSIEDIEVFIDWAKKNLPFFINIDDIETLKDNLLSSGVRVGAFVMHARNLAGGLNINGTIYTGADSSYKYHEAFHSVFRMLLTDEQIDEYLKRAKKELRAKIRSKKGYEFSPGVYVKSWSKALEMFRNLHEDHKALSDKELQDLFAEEYMADEFDKFKMNPKSTKTDSFIKSLFNKIKEILASLFSRFNKNELTELYKSIDSGKYKSANLMNNRFTQSDRLLEDGTLTANALIPFHEKGKSPQYLNSTLSDTIIRQIYARVVNAERNNEGGPFNINKTIEDSIEKFQDLYKGYFITKSDKDQIIAKNILLAFINQKNVIINEVRSRLNYIGLTDEYLERAQEEGGPRSTEQYGLSAELLGSEKSLPNFVRKYFAATVMESKDAFGNTMLTKDVVDENGVVIQKGEKIITGIDVDTAYHGWLKASANKFDVMSIFNSLYAFSTTSNTTAAVFNKLLADLGVEQEQILEGFSEAKWDPVKKEFVVETITTKNNALLHKILKAFENERLGYRFTKSTEKGNVYSFDSMEQNDVKAQINDWAASQMKIIRKKDVAKDSRFEQDALGDNAIKILKTGSFKSDAELIEASKEIAKNIFEAIGIKLSPTYIQYHFIKKLAKGRGKFKTASVYQYSIYNINPQGEIINDDLLNGIAEAIQNNTFLYTKGGYEAKLKQLAANNALFDETVGSTTFLNPERELVYAHQLPTYMGKMFSELNYSEIEKYATGFLELNYLLNDKNFQEYVRQGFLIPERAAGILDDDNNGASYGKLTPEEFLSYVINLYTGNVSYGQIKSTKKFKDKKGNIVGTAPVFTRVHETGRTGSLVDVPIIESVTEESEISDTVIDAFYNYVKQEFERIQYEANENNNPILSIGFNAEIDSDGVATRTTYEKTKGKDEKGRAFKLSKTKSFLKVNKSVIPVESSFILDKIENLEEGSIYLSGDSILNQILKNGKTTVTIVSNGKEITKTFSKKPMAFYNDFSEIELSQEEFNKYFSDKKTSVFTEQVKVKNPATGMPKRFYVSKDTQSAIDSKDVQKIDFTTVEKGSIVNKLQDLANDPANADKSFEELLKENADLIGTDDFKKIIREKLELEFNNIYEFINSDDMIKDKISNSIKNGLASFNASGSLNKTRTTAINNQFNLKRGKDGSALKHNLKQIFFNNWINAFSINQILLGDHAKSFGDGIAEIKRAKAQVAAIISARTYVTAPELGIDQIVDEFDMIALSESVTKSLISGENIDDADAQVWMTLNAFKHTWFGVGKLTKSQATVIDKLKNGEKITADEIYGIFKDGQLQSKGFIQKGEMLNSKKFLYADAENLVKMSASILFPEDTSRKVGNEWVAKENKPLLHNLRVTLENYEAKTGRLAMTAPLSAIKKVKYNVNNINDLSEVMDIAVWDEKNQKYIPPVDKLMKLDASYFGLQQVNPSNKNEVTDPTQIVNIIQSFQNEDEKVTINGVEYPIRAIKQRFSELKSDIIEHDYIAKTNLLFPTAMENFKISRDLGNITPEFLSFLRYAKASLIASNSSSHMLEYFDLSDDGYKKYNLNIPYVSDKFNQLILSFFTKGVFKQKTPGTTFTLKSDLGDRIFRMVYSVQEVRTKNKDGEEVVYYIPDKQEVIRESVYYGTSSKYRDMEIQFHIDKQRGVLSNFGSDSNLEGLKGAVENSKGKGVLIVDRMRIMNEYTYSNKNDLTTWKATGKYVEGIAPALNRHVYDKVDQGKILSSKDIQDLYEHWINEYNPTKKGKEIIRSEVKGFDPVRAKAEFAKIFDFKYNKKQNKFEPRGFETIPDVIAKMFTVRIPSQWLHSTMPVKQVDFMHAMHGTVMSLAREMVEITGGDFDIDKLYAHLKEYYYRYGKFIEYGKDKNLLYSEYIRYVNGKVKQIGNIYNDAYDKYTKTGLTTNSFDDALKEQVKKDQMSDKTLYALSTLGLPRTKAEFDAFHKANDFYPFPAALQNELLDIKYALATNKGVTEKSTLYKTKDGEIVREEKAGKKLNEKLDKELDAIAYIPADMEPLKKLWEDFLGSIPEWAASKIEGNIDVDNLLGQARSYESNQTGTRLIGASVRPNGYLSILGLLGIKLRTDANGKNWTFEFNGNIHDKFGELVELKANDELGNMTQYIISALITAATDNANDRYASKFGLNKNSLSIITNWVSLGVPLKTAFLLINNPEIQSLYKEFGEGSELNYKAAEKLRNYKDLLKALTNEDVDLNISDDDLLFNLKNFSQFDEILTEKIQDDEFVVTDDIVKYLKNQIKILTSFIKGSELSSFTFNIGEIFSLQKGIKDENDILNIERAINNLNLTGTILDNDPFDAKEIFVYDKTKGEKYAYNKLYRTYYRIFKNLTEEVLPSMSLVKTKAFREMYTSALNNFGSVKNIGAIQLQNDLLSYLTIKAYIKSIDSDTIFSLNNDRIYLDDDNSISKRILDLLENEDLKDNYFLNTYLNIKNRNDENNFTGQNLLEHNIIAKLTGDQKRDVQNDFMELYTSLKYQADAIAIVHYIMLKDGLQSKYNSIIQAVAPIALTNFSETVDAAFDALRKETNIENVFGNNLDELYNDFIINYMQSAAVKHSSSMRYKKVNNIREFGLTKEQKEKDDDLKEIFGIKEDIPARSEKDLIEDATKKIDGKAGAPMYVDNYRDKVVINPYKLELTDEDVENFKAKLVKKDDKELKDFDFWMGKRLGLPIDKSDKNYYQADFPAIMDVNGKTYVLKTLYSKNGQSELSLNEPTYKGIYAEYVEATIKGAITQFGAGFVADGTIPLASEIEIENEKKAPKENVTQDQKTDSNAGNMDKGVVDEIKKIKQVVNDAIDKRGFENVIKALRGNFLTMPEFNNKKELYKYIEKYGLSADDFQEVLNCI